MSCHDMRDPFARAVAKPNVFGESSDSDHRQQSQKGAHGGNWFPP